MANNLVEIASEIILKGGSLSSSERYLSKTPAPTCYDNCDCFEGDCSDCYCTDCN